MDKIRLPQFQDRSRRDIVIGLFFLLVGVLIFRLPLPADSITVDRQIYLITDETEIGDEVSIDSHAVIEFYSIAEEGFVAKKIALSDGVEEEFECTLPTNFNESNEISDCEEGKATGEVENIIKKWEIKSKFVLTSLRAGITIEAPDLILSTALSLYVVSAAIILAGTWQVFKGFQQVTAWVVLIVAFGIMAFFIWATLGKSINLTGMLVSSLVRATPIAFAALSGIYSERSGVVNIGIEGMMLVGAQIAVVVASLTGSLFIGLIGGILAGGVVGMLHAVLSIRYKVNQIVSGAGIIILSLGLTSYLHRSVLEVYSELNTPGPAIAAFQIPFLWKIPVIGPLFFNQSPVIYLLFFMIVATVIIMNHTRWGLRVRAVGEHPRAADTLGINVYRTRFQSVLISGMIAGLAGAYMSIGSAGRFNEGMTAGKGFLGLAAMIFGNWEPVGAFFGALIFGFFDSWQEKLSILQVGIPVELLGMAPYLATMIVLAGLIGRSRMPAANGVPYEKEG
ncbi:MAG: ABC transporter permease [Chloroflexi bacterium]|nr:ABC transporter permease [Chloroflexota bacterium]